MLSILDQSQIRIGFGVIIENKNYIRGRNPSVKSMIFPQMDGLSRKLPPIALHCVVFDPFRHKTCILINEKKSVFKHCVS